MKTRRLWLPLVLCALLSLTLASCDDDLPADNPRSTVLIGNWYYDGSSGSPSFWGDSQFTFRANGYGYYYGTDEHGYNSSWAISWQSYGGRQLTVWFDDGTTWNFDYALNGYGDLMLSPWEDPGTTLYYTSR